MSKTTELLNKYLSHDDGESHARISREIERISSDLDHLESLVKRCRKDNMLRFEESFHGLEASVSALEAAVQRLAPSEQTGVERPLKTIETIADLEAALRNGLS